jgi:hypothetical protein
MDPYRCTPPLLRRSIWCLLGFRSWKREPTYHAWHLWCVRSGCGAYATEPD